MRYILREIALWLGALVIGACALWLIYSFVEVVANNLGGDVSPWNFFSLMV